MHDGSPLQYPPHIIVCAGDPVAVRLPRRRWWQFASDGAVNCFLQVGEFQPAAAQVVLAGAGISPILLYPGREVVVSFQGVIGVRVLVWGCDVDDIAGEWSHR